MERHRRRIVTSKLLTTIIVTLAVLECAAKARSEEVSCFEADSSCKADPECQPARRLVRNKCQITQGRCSAAAKDLTRCADNIDILRASFFPVEHQCSCFEMGFTGRKLAKCTDIYNRVYSNPCFASGRTGDDVIDDVASQGGDESNATEAELEKLDNWFADGNAKPPKRDYRPRPPAAAPPPRNRVATTNHVTAPSPATTTHYYVTSFQNTTIVGSIPAQDGPGGMEIALIALGSFLLLALSAIAFVCIKRKRRSGYSAAQKMKKSSTLISYHDDRAVITSA